jgi:glycosyltransferase involved in cell wall biosynthesis
LLFSAFFGLSPKFPDARILMVGGGPASAECKAEVARLGLAEKVHFTGFRPRNEIQPICQAGDVFAFPSTTDTQAIVVCEALCAGLPCVAVRAGGTPEVIRDGIDGFLTSNSREEFAAKLEQLLSNRELRRKMSAEALSGSGRFSEAEMGERFIQFYERTIDMHGKGK